MLLKGKIDFDEKDRPQYLTLWPWFSLDGLFFNGGPLLWIFYILFVS